MRASLAAALLWVCAPTALAETPGKDGPFTVSGTQVLNEYAPLASPAAAGSSSITAGNVAGNLPSLSPGDLVMIYQANGATISTTDSAAYGAVLSYNNAGRYEFQTVDSVSGNTLTFQSYNNSCTGLRYSYDATGAQVLRVPQYTTLSVPNGSAVRAQNWNGSTGGIVALHVRDTLDLQGTIRANAAGFRGGAVDNQTSPTNGPRPSGYRYTAANQGAEKGESIAGLSSTLTGGRYGRGAPANGGGGGNGHNAGGGGGANGGNVALWTGQGNPDNSNPSWEAAWDLDPSLDHDDTSSGGGRGGYTYARAGDALTLPPGQWGFDKRREVGGMGGRPLDFDGAGRIFFGGGGGAGDGNNNAAGAGGRGGGIAFVIAGGVTGSGRIQARGAQGQDTSPNHNDGPGGGGGGGTVMLSAPSISSALRLQVDGGAGGDQLITNDENEGPGGGGGGGVAAVSSGNPVRQAGGGANGVTNSRSMTEFPPNGATRGAVGNPNASAPDESSLPFCAKPDTTMEATKAVAPWPAGSYMTPGSDVAYTFTLTAAGFDPVSDGSIVLIDPLPSDIEFYNGEFDPAGPPVSGPVEFTPNGSGLSCCTGAAQLDYSSTTTGAPVWGYSPLPGYDPAVRYVRIRPSGAMAAGTTATLRFRARIK